MQYNLFMEEYDMKVLEINQRVLKSPLVDIEIIDDNGGNITFDIAESPNRSHTVYNDNNPDKISEIVDFDERVIRIRTAELEIGRKYRVRASKPLEWRDSDENLFTYGYTEGGQTFAISFPDPNDEYKVFVEYRKPDDKMKWFDFNGVENLGTIPAEFYLIDREQEFIYIAAAWIWNIHDHMDDYESAAEVFTWII